MNTFFSQDLNIMLDSFILRIVLATLSF